MGLSLWSAAMSGQHAYSCVRNMAFLRRDLIANPGYSEALALAKSRPGEFCVEIGVGVGTDLRQARNDGLKSPALAVDVTPDLWNLGTELYADSSNPPGKFLYCDATDPMHLSKGGAFEEAMGSTSVVVCQLVFHVLGKEAQKNLVANAASLLSPGGTFIGLTFGTSAEEGQEWWPEAGVSASATTTSSRFLHSHDSLHRLLTDAGFVDVVVQETEWVITMEGKTFFVFSAKLRGNKCKRAFVGGA